MTDYPEITRTRVRRTLERLRSSVVSATVPLQIAAWHVHGEPVGFAEARAQSYVPFSTGEAFGGAWDTTWFRLLGDAPEGAALRVRFGASDTSRPAGEGLVWSAGGVPLHGLSRYHTDVPVPPGRLEVYVEAAANPQTSMVRAPQMLDPEPEGPPIMRLLEAHLVVVDGRRASLVHDLRVLTGLLDELDRHAPRWWELLAALDGSCAAIDAGEDESAEASLRAELARPALPGHRVTAVGHAHIDSAWLWPVRETIRKCARTFSTALALMRDDPAFTFVCSQAQQYQWMKDHYPAIWDGIRERVARGQWEPVGSMWVEPDCNLPSGESLVRQIVHGKRFFLEELGVETTDAWLPDAFGYSGALPQILALAGCSSFLSQKLSWNQLNPFPHHTFWWEGIDGTRVLAHFPPADTYNGEMAPEELSKGVRAFRDHGRSSRSLYVYGHGDGGGGPTREMLESARRMSDLEGLPSLQLGSAREFFRAVREESPDLAVWQGELYLELHRGTYTTQARTKLANRRSERLLYEAELWSAAAGDPYPSRELDEAWRAVLLNQFHDVLPGSGINWVYRDAAGAYERVRSSGERIVGDALARLSSGPGTVAFNALAHERTEVVDDGRALVTVPACGYAEIEQYAGPARVRASPTHIENDVLRVEWDADGLLRSVLDKQHGREVLAGAGNLLQLNHDRPNDWDAWDVDPFAFERSQDVRSLEALEVVDDGPLRASVRMSRRLGASTVEQVLSLDAGSRRLDVATHVDWREEHRMLKVAFPVRVRSARATYEIQFGHVERPTHANTSWDVARFEVCGHTWADLSEPGYGVAILNDCKYGHDIRGSVMRLSLLRSPTWPDPDADRGEQRFTYSLYPHAGTLQDGGVIEAAHSLNHPLRLVRGSGRRSFLSVSRPGVVVSAFKRADRSDGLVIRLYEAYGARGPAGVRVGVPVSRAWRCDLLERELDEVPVDGDLIHVDLRPFEIVTLKLARSTV